MKRHILTILVFLVFGFATFANAQASISISDTDQVYVTPDIVKFSLSSLTAGKTANEALSKSNENVKKLKDFLSSLKINEADVSVLSYNYQDPEATEDTNKYSTAATILVQNVNFNDFGKILTKAYELKMTVNKDISYSISDKLMDDVKAKYEKTALEKLTEKANRVLSSKNYYVDPSSIQLTTNTDYYNYNETPVYDLKENLLPSGFKLVFYMYATFSTIRK